MGFDFIFIEIQRITIPQTSKPLGVLRQRNLGLGKNDFSAEGVHMEQNCHTECPASGHETTLTITNQYYYLFSADIDLSFF